MTPEQRAECFRVCAEAAPAPTAEQLAELRQLLPPRPAAATSAARSSRLELAA